jgi:hypothetical protein
MNRKEFPAQKAEQILEQIELQAGFFKNLSNTEETTVYLKRHGEYEKGYPRDENFNKEISGSLTPEGKTEARRHYKEFIREILKNTPEDLGVDIFIAHSPTKWLDFYGERATESANELLEAAKKVLDASDKDARILSDLGIHYRKGQLSRRGNLESLRDENSETQDQKVADFEKLIFDDRKEMIEASREVAVSDGEITPISRLREADIHLVVAGISKDQIINRLAFISALRKIHGKDFWKPYVESKYGKLYENKSIEELNDEEMATIKDIFGLSSLTKGQLEAMGDPRDLEKIRQMVGAETPKDIANRVMVALRGANVLRQEVQKKERTEADAKGKEYKGRKFIAIAISHGDDIESFMKQAADGKEEDYTHVGFNQGVRIDMNGRQGNALALSGNKYDFELKKI